MTKTPGKYFCYSYGPKYSKNILYDRVKCKKIQQDTQNPLTPYIWDILHPFVHCDGLEKS